MKSTEFTKRLAKRSKLTQAAAADQLSRVVHEILQRVRKGEPASLPGLGTFITGQDANYHREHAARKPKNVPR